MPILDRLQGPADLRGLTEPELEQLAAELRETIIRTVAATGGQSLEATIALYERAVALQRRCERLLGEAELRVQQLLARPGGVLAAVDVVPEDAEEA